MSNYPEEMKALILKNGKLVLESNVKVPKLKKGEALIEVLYTGICSTDLSLQKGYLTFEGIPGHEFVGIVRDLLTTDKIMVSKFHNQKVVCHINWSNCVNKIGHLCKMCKLNLSKHCLCRNTIGLHNVQGAFAEYIVVPITNLILVSAKVSDLNAVFTEPLAAALEFYLPINRAKLQNSENILLIGTGKLGSLIYKAITNTLDFNFDLYVLVRSLKSKKRILQLGCPEHKIKCLEEEGKNKNWESNWKPEAGFDNVIEATGNESGFNLALNLVRPRGKIILKSTFEKQITINMTNIVVKEIQIIGSRCGDMEYAMDFLSNNQLQLDELIEKIFPFDKAIEAWQFAKQPGKLKVILKIKQN
ncbi:nad-dependent alcohol dehydrogenase [Anaeramoeba flamelloides]|uniref:Nad-dependent alcohol dehydrogenase n=1 Tax=Anaeramoeba flamelloides TaxID=1746091 RepID=A0AAV7ZH20_9EUKA|nr:nad-dependent alcohol dehydrogenase [Anaeramoeba flamelloides]